MDWLYLVRGGMVPRVWASLNGVGGGAVIC